MSLKERLIKNVLWLFSGDILDKVLSYILIVVIARKLGDTGLGQYSFVFAFVGLTYLLADMGVGSYLLREAARSTKRMQIIFSNALTLKILLIILTFIVTVALTFLTLDKPPIVLWSIVVSALTFSLLHIGGNLCEATFMSRNKMHHITITRIIERLIALGLGLYVLLKYNNLLYFFIALFVAYLFRFAYNLYFIRGLVKLRPAYDKKVMIQILKGGIPLWLTATFAFIYFRIDIIMLSTMINDQVVGWYSAAYKLIDAMSFIPHLIFTATFPSMSLLFTTNKKVLILLLNRVIRYLVTLAIPMTIGVILLGDRIIEFIYGSAFFANAAIALNILIFAEAILFITFILGNALNAINKEKHFTIVLASLAVVNVVLNFIVIPKYSYVGAAFTTVITEILSLIVLSIMIKKFLAPVKYEVMQPLIAAAIMGVIIYQLNFLAVWWLILIGIASYFAALAVLGLKSEDKELIQQTIAQGKKLISR